MPGKKTLEEQILFALSQADAGTPVAEICRDLGVSVASFYRWRKIYAGLGLPEIRLVKQLLDENKKLKRLLVYLTREHTKQQDELDLTPPKISSETDQLHLKEVTCSVSSDHG